MGETSRLDEIEERLKRLERTLFPDKTPARWPDATPAPVLYERGCARCGIKWDGPMGYVCPRTDCPTTPRVT